MVVSKPCTPEEGQYLLQQAVTLPAHDDILPREALI